MASRTGIEVARVERIRQGWHKQIRAYNAAKILRVPIPAELRDYNDDAHVPAVGTTRRLQALQVVGYTREMMSDVCGVHRDTLTLLTLSRRSLVKASTAVAVQDMFTALSMDFPPDTLASKRARNKAQRQGWSPPLAWDDDIDNPDAEPQFPPDDKNVWYEDYKMLRDRGMAHREIAQRMGIERKSLTQRLRRLDATTNSSQEYQQVWEGDEQMVCASR